MIDNERITAKALSKFSRKSMRENRFPIKAEQTIACIRDAMLRPNPATAFVVKPKRCHKPFHRVWQAPTILSRPASTPMDAADLAHEIDLMVAARFHPLLKSNNPIGIFKDRWLE